GQKQLKMVFADGGDELMRTIELSEKERNLFSITDEEAAFLAKQALIIEKHYQRPMDIEWAKDGESGELFIVQARPETVQSRNHARVIERYELKARGNVLIEGRSIGQRIGQGKALVVKSLADMHLVKEGD